MEAPPSSSAGGIEVLFEKVRRLGNSTLENHIQVGVVLEAASEAIKQNGNAKSGLKF